MEKAAVWLTKLVGYVSVKTVEYLYSYKNDFFCILELNPRLQVEHPTTEMVSGVNLLAAQNCKLPWGLHFIKYVFWLQVELPR